MATGAAAGEVKGETVLVTGASGVIGSCLVRCLLAHGYSVHAAILNPDDRTETDHLRALAAAAVGGDESRVRFFRCDLLDGAAMLAAARGCSGVFHLACSSLPRPSSRAPHTPRWCSSGGRRRSWWCRRWRARSTCSAPPRKPGECGWWSPLLSPPSCPARGGWRARSSTSAAGQTSTTATRMGFGTLLQRHWRRRRHGSLHKRMVSTWWWLIQGLFWAR